MKKGYLIVTTISLVIATIFFHYHRVLGITTSLTKTGWSLIATGDVMLGRSVNTQSLQKNDFTWAFKHLAPLLKSADLTLINLESPLLSICSPTDQGMIFCGTAKHLEGLKSAGVDLANIDNNHIYNHGQNGVNETINLLNQNNISPVGLDLTVTKNIDNQKVTFLGFETLTTRNRYEIAPKISLAKKNSDLVIVSFHWGTEYQDKPNQDQVTMAHNAIDAGADVIIGHHPHWVQSEETYQGKPIFYSLGNLIFDQMWSDKTRQGLVVKLNFQGKNLISIDRYPITIYDYGQPRLN